MTIDLDTPQFIGDTVVAALAERAIAPLTGGQGMSARCWKRPVAILVRRNELTIAFDPSGCQIDLDAFEQRYPGQRETFERRAMHPV